MTWPRILPPNRSSCSPKKAATAPAIAAGIARVVTMTNDATEMMMTPSSDGRMNITIGQMKLYAAKAKNVAAIASGIHGSPAIINMNGTATRLINGMNRATNAPSTKKMLHGTAIGRAISATIRKTTPTKELAAANTHDPKLNSKTMASYTTQPIGRMTIANSSPKPGMARSARTKAPKPAAAAVKGTGMRRDRSTQPSTVTHLNPIGVRSQAKANAVSQRTMIAPTPTSHMSPNPMAASKGVPMTSRARAAMAPTGSAKRPSPSLSGIVRR